MYSYFMQQIKTKSKTATPQKNEKKRKKPRQIQQATLVYKNTQHILSIVWPRRGVLDTTLCGKVCQWLATGLWFSPVSSTNKTAMI